MGVRKTESRIPEGFQPGDLGEAVTSTDGHCALVSFITSPLVINRENIYVVFVTDPSLASATKSFEWTSTENGGTPVTTITEFGEIAYTPKSTGTLNLRVQFLGGAEKVKLTLLQEIIKANPILEELISKATNEPGPGVGSPDTASELINDYNPYYQNIRLKTGDEESDFKRFVFSMVYDGVSHRTVERRKKLLDLLAMSLNSKEADFATNSAEGLGVCNIRLTMLAMTLS